MIWLLAPVLLILVLFVLFGGKQETQESVQIEGVFEKTRRNNA